MATKKFSFSKKCIGFSIGLVLLLSVAINPMAASPVGDLNGDDIVSAPDLTILKKVLLQDVEDVQYDLNADGTTNILDLVKLKKIIVYTVEKFTAMEKTIVLANGENTVALGDLFTANEGVTINSSSVVVTISSADNSISAEYTADTTDWAQGTITFTGTSVELAKVSVEITDNDYCFATTATVIVDATDKVKFNAKTDVTVDLAENDTVTVGDLFEAVENANINSATVEVSVSGVKCEITEDTADWTNGTIKFTSTGTATVTITDGNYCEETSNVVSVIATYSDKFSSVAVEEIVLANGDSNIVSLGDLFTAIEGAEIDADGITVTVTPVEGDITGTYTANTEDWTQGTIEFTGSGTADITITDNDYCNNAINTVTVDATDKVKFNAKTSMTVDLAEYDTITVGDLFEAVENANINSATVDVNVSGVECEITEDTADWTNGTIKFTNTGTATVTITDGNYCEETSNEVSVIATYSDKFSSVAVEEIVLANGDSNIVSLGDLFTAIEGAEIDADGITVTVTPVDGDITGTYTANTDDWTQGTIEFTGSGRADITITDNDYCNNAINTVTVDATNKAKFAGNGTKEIVLANGDSKVVCLGELFTATDVANINSASVEVNVNGVEYEITKDSADWTKSTITFIGGGTATVTITDGVYCETAENTVVVDEANKAKFKATEGVVVENILTDATVTLGELFTATGEANINNATVDVNVSGVECEITEDTADWTNGTIKFTSTGTAIVTITDGVYCETTENNVEVKAVEVEKFALVFENTDDYLYRVGNANAVELGKLFKALEGAEIGNVAIEVKTVRGDATGTYTSNATWSKGTIKFSGTGVVSVTIDDDKYAKAITLNLEVLNATNITSAVGTISGGDMVLLCDVNTSTYVNYWNCTLYGNGFTYSLNGAPTAYNSKQGHGVIITKNATLDNLQIVGDIYNSYGAYTTNDYYNAAVDVVGDTVIQNCYIANCAAPVSAREDVTITNTTLYGGTVANLIIKSGTATLENVTTANFDDGRELVGMGIVIHADATESAKLVLNGLTQYNFISEAKVPTDSYAKNLHTAMFGSSCSKYHFGTEPNRYVNAGIISMTAVFDEDDINGTVAGYDYADVSLGSVNGIVYTQLNTNGSVNNNYSKVNDPHVAKTQGAVAPEYSFDYTTKNYQAKQDGSNDYCYEENGIVYISMDKGDTFNWDTSILTATKAGETLNYTVKMNDVDYTGKSITFNTAGEYEVLYTYTDNNNFTLDENGNITTYSQTYTKKVKISVAVIEAATKHAEFTFGSSNTASTTVAVGNNTYVMPNVSATSSTIGSTTVSGNTIYYPIVEIVMSDGKTSHSKAWNAYFPVFSGAVTITDYADKGLGDAVTYGSSTQSMPSGLSIVGDPAELFKYQSSSSAGTSPVVKNGILVYSSPSISAKRSEYNTVIQYSYQDNAGTTYYYYIGYHAPAQSYSSCVTSDTLVTLANGSQKRIDEVTYDDKLLVWDFYKGEYTVAPSSIIMNHGYDNYDVLTLNFADGTAVNTINGHGFFDVANNEFVVIDTNNVADYIGHDFVKVNGEEYSTVKLVDYSIKQEYTESWSILTAEHYNCVLEGMWTLTPAEIEGSPEYLMPYEVGNDMKYDEVKMQADIEEYGLYTYEDFAEYMSYEQFKALNLANFKVSVGKGYITWDEIMTLINIHIG